MLDPKIEQLAQSIIDNEFNDAKAQFNKLIAKIKKSSSDPCKGIYPECCEELKERGETIWRILKKALKECWPGGNPKPLTNDILDFFNANFQKQFDELDLVLSGFCNESYPMEPTLLQVKGKFSQELNDKVKSFLDTLK